ncbi:uncharacterized protein LOC134192016 isoform X2 [Corticium candelabrum]|nr:uncharacterized protein LOC134192016 isoform X2 [Corticium candelabrum]
MVRHKRSVVVEKFLPRMAYVSSEVVIYVTRDDLSDVRCIEEVCRFALDQTNNAHAVKPYLIIISNRTEYASATIEQTTKEFYDTHCPEEELNDYYREIKVQRVPMKDRSPEDFESRLDELISTIDNMLESKIPERDLLGIHYSEIIWLLVFNILISEYFDLDKPIHFGEVIQKAMIPKEDFFVHQVFRFFITVNQYLNQYLDRYHADSDDPTVHRSFHIARASAIEMLGALHAADINEWANELGSNVVKSPVQLKDRQDAAMKDFEKLNMEISNYAPCTAVFNRKGTLITCVRHRMEHDSNLHCNPTFHFHEKEMLAETTSGFYRAVNKIKKKYHRLQNKSFPAKWEGSYQFDDPVEPSDLQGIFMETMKKLENDFPIDKSRIINAVARVAIVRKAYPVVLGASSELRHLGAVSDQHLLKCIVCLSTHKRRDAKIGVKQLIPCGHTFCEVCIDPFRSANGEEQVSVLSGESTLNGSCPLCHSRVAQLSQVA